MMLNNIYLSFYAECKARFSTPRIIVENFLNPLFVLFIFGIALNSFLGKIIWVEKEIPYLVFFLSGIVSITLITNCSVAATRFFLDKYIGTFDYYFSFPIERSSIILGRLLFHIILSVIQILCMTFFVKMIYSEFVSFNLNYLYFLIINVICSIGWFCILLYFSLIIKTQDTFNVMYYLIMTPVVYLSSIYYPANQFLLPLRIFAYANPLTWCTDISRVLILGGKGDNGDIGLLSRCHSFKLAGKIINLAIGHLIYYPDLRQSYIRKKEKTKQRFTICLVL